MTPTRPAARVPSGTMSHVASIRVGRIEVEVICEGYAPLPLTDEAPGHDVDWNGETARYPWAFHDAHAWAWHVHAFALHTSSGLVLVDTGAGPFGPWAPWVEEVGADAWSGLDRDAVRHVVLTHLHADHAGGAASADGGASFSNARYHVHPADWHHFLAHPVIRETDGRRYDARAAMAGLSERGAVSVEPLDHEIVPGVSVMHSPGHTPGHRSILVHDAGAVLLLTGDLLHVPLQVAHRGWLSSHDIDPMLGAASRRRLLFRAAAGEWRVGVSHFARPFGAVEGGAWRSV
jgi:glyoxylase-like metal-dependent hydrolase (beta-lactamase superfamily II)